MHPEVMHGVFLRHGGVSTGNFTSLNASYSCGKSRTFTEENRRRICKILQIDALISGCQVRGTKVACIKNVTHSVGSCDALMTRLDSTGLIVLHADCQAALFYDPIKRAVATAHVGWRGQMQGLYRHVISSMKIAFGSRPQDLLVGIAPSLGPQNAEFKN